MIVMKIYVRVYPSQYTLRYFVIIIYFFWLLLKSDVLSVKFLNLHTFNLYTLTYEAMLQIGMYCGMKSRHIVCLTDKFCAQIRRVPTRVAIRSFCAKFHQDSSQSRLDRQKYQALLPC